MDTSIEIRRLLITVARELSARDGGAATRAHLIGAFGGLGAILRQEFDRAMAHGPELLDDDGEPLVVPDSAESPADEQVAESEDIAAENADAGEDASDASDDTQAATNAKAKTARAKKKDTSA
jgi:hypothetical protein